MSRGEARSALSKLPIIRPCEGPCQRMTRPSKRKLADHPDTVARMDGRYCRECYYNLYPEAPQRRAKELTDDHIHQIRNTTEHWLEGRRERLLRRMGPHKPPYVRQKRIYQ